MDIGVKDISKVLFFYNINYDVVNHNFFINGFDEKTLEAKFVIKADLSNSQSFVVKFIRQNMNPHDVIEKQSRFSEHLRSRGILVPKRYKNNGVFCSTCSLNGLMFDVTVEDYVGEEIKFIDNNLVYKVGQLMARNHCIAEEDKLLINASTLFDAVGHNEVSGYNDLVRLKNEGLINQKIFNDINSVYEKKINRLKTLWGVLPKYATQGDYSLNNLTFIGNELGVFDFNNAGDETLIGDMILEGLLVAYEHDDLASDLADGDKLNLFRSFVNGYISQRPLSDKEKYAFNDIYAIAKGMWFSRILYNDDSLEKLLKNHEHEKAEVLLQKIYQDLICENFAV